MSKKKVSTLGEQIRKLREGRHLSLQEVAGKLEIDSSLLARFERNERPISKLNLIKLAKFFDVEYDEFITEALADKIAYQILEENSNSQILKLAEKKIEYIKNKRNEK